MWYVPSLSVYAVVNGKVLILCMRTPFLAAYQISVQYLSHLSLDIRFHGFSCAFQGACGSRHREILGSSISTRSSSRERMEQGRTDRFLRSTRNATTDRLQTPCRHYRTCTWLNSAIHSHAHCTHICRVPCINAVQRFIDVQIQKQSAKFTTCAGTSCLWQNASHWSHSCRWIRPLRKSWPVYMKLW